MNVQHEQHPQQPEPLHEQQKSKQQLAAANKNTMHHALGPFIVLSQFMGTFPVAGIWPTSNVAYVHFSWCSVAVFVSLALIGFSLIDLVLSTKVVLERGLKLYTVGPLSFSIISLASIGSFLQLARDWPQLIRQTHRCEQVFLKKQYRSRGSLHFSHKIRVFGGILLGGAALEHCVYKTSAIYNNNLQITQCNLTVDFWQNYFMRERLQIFSITHFRVWLIPLVEWITISTTFAWNFVDIFLILVCRCIKMRFVQMHWRIERHMKEHMPSDFWREVRYDFLNLIELMQLCDSKLAVPILVSCCNNLYFICVQIFHSFNNKGNFMNEIYFWFSLIFVLVRLLTMMLCAAAVHDETNRIMATMYEIPSAFWCLELKRLNEMIISDFIAFSGKRFFYLTRRLIFAMAGTIIIYELVLTDQVEDSDVVTDFCTARNV